MKTCYQKYVKLCYFITVSILQRCPLLAKDTNWQSICHHLWDVRRGGKLVSCQTSLQSLLTALSFSRSGKWSALAFETSVQPDYWWQGPRDLPACLPACTSLFWTADPNTLHLLEWHVAAILKGGSSATPLMSTTVSKAGKPFSLLSVFHLDREFSILERDFFFWSEADKEQIYMV